MQRSNTCSKCGSSMTLGFALDNNEGGRRSVSSWVEGEPRKSFWKGIALGGRRQIPISTWRCNRCGLLESYANTD